MLLDDMVLDIGDYIKRHSGGSFTLEANIGRDVSKYFYGGYALENIIPVKPHTHSNDARRLVDKFAIAYLKKEAPIAKMKIKEASGANRTGTAQTITFHQPNKTTQPVLANALLDPRAMAMHYVVKSTALQNTWGASPLGEFHEEKSGIKRHYTEAFVMRPGVYQALIDLAKNKDEKSAQTIIDAVKANNSEDVALTIKGYKQNEGLSKFIFEDL